MRGEAVSRAERTHAQNIEVEAAVALALAAHLARREANLRRVAYQRALEADGIAKVASGIELEGFRNL